jgi:uncharacterized protein DUF1206
MSSANQHVRSTASRAADSKPLEYLTRGGFVCYGVIHLLFAWLALQIAFGRSSGESDQSGALQIVARQPAGKFLLILIIIGMTAMAIWQAFEAAIGESGPRTAIAERVVSGARTILYLYFAWLALKVVQGVSSSQASGQQQTTAKLMAATGGRWLVGIIGLAVVGIGVGLVGYGVKKAFMRRLKTGEMRPSVRKTVRRLGVAGYTAKGIAYGIAGVLLVTAAVTYDAQKSRGLDGALRELAGHSYGPWLLGLVALGIAAFGVYCFFQSRYRKV